MIANTFVLVIAMSLSVMTDINYSTTLIPVEISFCEVTSGEGESICSIQEAEKSSLNKIFFDQYGENPKLLIDKRNVTSDKMKYIFRNEQITIGKKNTINMPYLHKSLLIKPGLYSIELVNKGYVISLTN